MHLDQMLVDTARSLAERRWPGREAGAAALYTRTGRLLTSVCAESLNAAAQLCHETGAICEAHKFEEEVTASVCISREDADAPFVILPPCGICCERLAYWGGEVEVAVPHPDDPTRWVAKLLKEVMPHYCMNAWCGGWPPAPTRDAAPVAEHVAKPDVVTKGDSVTIIERRPTVEEFAAITASVGFKPHPSEAIALGLANSFFSVCAEVEGKTVGTGRIVGDGGLDFYLTGIMVIPAWQRRGVGSRIVAALVERVRQVPYANILVEALPLPGLDPFYARFGFRATRRYAPGMHLWLNEPAG